MNKNSTKRATDVDKTIGARVKMRRLEVGITQEQLANELGVSFQQVQKYERGMNGIRGSRMVQIAQALRVDISFFYGDGSKPEKTTSVTDTFISNPLGIRLATAFVPIPTPLQRKIVEMVEAFEHEQ